MKDRLEYRFFQALLLLIRLIPKTLLPALGSTLGSLLYYLRVRRTVVATNLEIAFGNEWTAVERSRICRNTYRHFGRVALEVLLLHQLSREELPEYIKIEGIEVLHRAASEGKGVVIAGNHLGHWELLSAGLAVFGSPFHVYAGRQRNALFDVALNRIRQRFGVTVISKSKTATIEMMRVLKRNGIVALAGDLNVPNDRLFVDFFGRKAAVGRGFGVLTAQRNSPLLFVWCVRESALRYRGYIKRIDYQVPVDRSATPSVIAQAFTNELQRIIRRYPDQYFWFNRRWKTRPAEEGDTDPYDPPVSA
jgi:Kdo2-lipid IVA lauroyltransferase/acyltransferase